MNQTYRIRRYVSAIPFVATICYAAMTGFLLLITGWTALDLAEQHRTLANANEMFDRLQSQQRAARSTNDGALAVSPPVVEGPTVTVAAAVVLQHVSAEATRMGSNILSSQVDLQDAGAQHGIVRVSVDLEIEQPALQGLLYELEAGSPFLFIDQLVIQVPESSTRHAATKVRVAIVVSGWWRSVK
ncbi:MULTISPECIES: type II secretion system protein GspM [Bradyrhizobium]|uniref:General secretion pathway protein GspM n=3 Tax=Bradyrhizobium TaxID=374 RepID=A0AAE5X8Y2_9BRAD|nr:MULTISPECIES: type II secretion system protein GspM [Bradyrhizobium]MCG2628164.1 type II secretion system protein GspM [Bradyrhizobium zhengyangense]MCG2643283.1 type II secretion system protein GspM [Bradyrhizobium zhengyangense]MCG2670403.1 type II secretion system protein GspM [Bradyrhizobium zhengyangense]MDN4985862.1 type II secretion system protein GspM [Bradyrhizobium sp. WYCCWR 13022]MDN5002759.1 type II secretion system protein GspM [Bradyrhizobium sp. WYCCWR 12677]